MDKCTIDRGIRRPAIAPLYEVENGRRVIHRDELADVVERSGMGVGLLVGAADGSTAVPLGPSGHNKAIELTAETLVMAGVDRTDRVVVALNNDGAGVGVLWAQAAASMARAACPWGPRQPRRLAQLLRTTSAEVLVTTPTLARQLLTSARAARTELPPLRLLVLVSPIELPALGFIADIAPRAAVVWCDPVFGLAMASRRLEERAFTLTRPGLVRLVPTPEPHRTLPLVEWTVALPWPPWDDVAIRTGVLGPSSPALAVPTGTIGDHILIGDRWLRLSVVSAVLHDAGVGPGDWTLEIERTLLGERAGMAVQAPGSTLEYIQKALNESSPVHIRVRGSDIRPPRPGLVDRRRQHVERSPMTKVNG